MAAAAPAVAPVAAAAVAPVAVAEAAPAQQTMGGGALTGSLIGQYFANKEALLVKQTMRGCIQECFGCEAKSEFHISDFSLEHLDFGWMATVKDTTYEKFPNELYALENSSFFMRCCFRDGRNFDMEVATFNKSSEKGDGGTPLIRYSKPCGFPVMCTIGGYPGCEEYQVTFPCCCKLPNMDALAPDGAVMSNSRYTCDMCLNVPKLMYSEGGKDIYKLRPPVCCGGCCIKCTCKKGGCNLPFYFWDPETGERIGGESEDEHQHPQILKVWSGLKKECCSTADTFAVFYPKGCTPERKAGILGMTFLIDFVVFERQGEK